MGEPITPTDAEAAPDEAAAVAAWVKMPLTFTYSQAIAVHDALHAAGISVRMDGSAGSVLPAFGAGSAYVWVPESDLATALEAADAANTSRRLDPFRVPTSQEPMTCPICNEGLGPVHWFGLNGHLAAAHPNAKRRGRWCAECDELCEGLFAGLYLHVRDRHPEGENGLDADGAMFAACELCDWETPRVEALPQNDLELLKALEAHDPVCPKRLSTTQLSQGLVIPLAFAAALVVGTLLALWWMS